MRSTSVCARVPIIEKKLDRKKFIRAKSELKTYIDLIKPHPMAA